jgi:hypothetical protein
VHDRVEWLTMSKKNYSRNLLVIQDFLFGFLCRARIKDPEKPKLYHRRWVKGSSVHPSIPIVYARDLVCGSIVKER